MTLPRCHAICIVRTGSYFFSKLKALIINDFCIVRFAPKSVRHSGGFALAKLKQAHKKSARVALDNCMIAKNSTYFKKL